MDEPSQAEFDFAVAAISRIDAVPTILEVICRITGMGFAAVARVTERRWIACAVRDEIDFGLKPGGELKVETTICSEIRDSGQAVVIDEVATDGMFRQHHTPAMYGFQSYISMPIFRANGDFFGTLCAIDPKPAKLNRPEIVGMFKMFCALIAFHLEGQEAISQSEAALLTERQAAELREQFIAVLGHDLRNPLAAIDSGMRLLGKEQLSEQGSGVIALLQGSVKRMSGLIDSVMDFARGRLGGGLSVNRVADAPLAAMLEQVVNELRTAWPQRTIETRFALSHPVECDPGRVGQMVSNLISNALAHGAADTPVTLSAITTAEALELTVANRGNPIPAQTIRLLFQPFYRLADQQGHKGLGLGLYIVSEITRAHGGTLSVISNDDETRFTVRLPRRG